MSRRLLILPFALVALVLAVSASAAPKKLTGTVGPGFTIVLKDAKGKSVKTLKPGKYTLIVKDKSPIHDFHIKGPGLDKVVTTVTFMGTKTVTVTLKKGTYTYVCDPHLTTMHGKVTVK